VQGDRINSYVRTIALCSAAFFCAPVRADKLRVTPDVSAVTDQIYSGDLDGGREAALRIQGEQPEDPIGYLLEAEALWWKIWCTSAEFKYGMNFPRHRAKLAGRPTLLGIGGESFLACGRQYRATRYGGDGILRGHGRRTGCATLWAAQRRAQHGAGGCARAGASVTGDDDERGTGGCGPWSRPLQLLR